MIRVGIFLLIVNFLSASVEGAGLETHFISIPYANKILNLRIGIQNPEGPVLGDILYVHGFADRLDNHQPLFRSWTGAGFRVIAFDLPSHGENSGSYNDLNNFSFKDLADLLAKVEQNTKPKSLRPLILSGWSTGGLLIVRMLQKNWTSGLSRPVSGTILFAPGISVRKTPWTFGDGHGRVTEATLTHDPNPPHIGPIKINSPFWSHLVFKFSPRLVAESILSQKSSFPTEIPTLVFTGGDTEDVYAKSWIVRSWIVKQNVSRKTSPKSLIINVSCPNGKHELDNETLPFGGGEVRNSAAFFAKAITIGKIEMFSSGPDTYGKFCSRAI